MNPQSWHSGKDMPPTPTIISVTTAPPPTVGKLGHKYHFPILLSALLLFSLQPAAAYGQDIVERCINGDGRACAYLQMHCNNGNPEACEAFLFALCMRGNQRACQELQIFQQNQQQSYRQSPQHQPRPQHSSKGNASYSACVSNCTNRWVWCHKACSFAIQLDDEDYHRARACEEQCDREKDSCERACR